VVAEVESMKNLYFSSCSSVKNGFVSSVMILSPRFRRSISLRIGRAAQHVKTARVGFWRAGDVEYLGGVGRRGDAVVVRKNGTVGKVYC